MFHVGSRFSDFGPHSSVGRFHKEAPFLLFFFIELILYLGCVKNFYRKWTFFKGKYFITLLAYSVLVMQRVAL